ncbi:MAG TPA: hypothetical protein ENI42_02860, partial [Thermoplasmatales archaeon]|nr:hypothetical protein [Thermoplasmatales archaeon]
YGNHNTYYCGERYYGPNIVFTKNSVSDGATLETSMTGSIDFSKTNIQVEGVDEPDIVKTDGTYIYMIANQSIYIIKAYPWANAYVVSRIKTGNNTKEIFINNNKLVIFESSYRHPENPPYNETCCWWYGVTTTIIKIYDIADRTEPKLVKEVESDGSYFDARMIGEYVYVITTEHTYDIYHVTNGNETINIPEIKIDGVSKKIPVTKIYYVDIPENDYTLTHVLAININDKNKDVNIKSFLLGNTNTMYVSQHNIYLACTKYNNQAWPLTINTYFESKETTVVHKISIKNGDISYAAQGEVPGRILNQFSMDEYNGFFRIATTTGHIWDGNSRNNIYILNQNLSRVSEIEDIAPGERIHSARFMGTKAYLVTFKKVDPFFTIDLSDPYNPKILGKLKIPGYSDYLHPYDENHIIGIGKETVEALEYQKEMRNLDFAWYQGIKIALFDVTDFEHPKEIAKIVIGDRGTDTPVLRDHKAFLFDREKNLLVIPVTVYEIDETIKEQHNGYTGNIYGEFTFQGVYVYRVTVEKGFEFKGRVTHRDDNEPSNGYHWYWDSDCSITRSLYIDNVLYTISNKMIKMNDLNTLEELKTVELC